MKKHIGQRGHGWNTVVEAGGHRSGGGKGNGSSSGGGRRGRDGGVTEGGKVRLPVQGTSI